MEKFPIQWDDGLEIAMIIPYFPIKYNHNNDTKLFCVIIFGDDGAYEMEEPAMHNFASYQSAKDYVVECKNNAEKSFKD